MDNTNFTSAYSSISDEELKLFRDYLCKNSGIAIPPEKAYLFETRLSKMMANTGADTFREFYNYVQSGSDPFITQKIINAMTINETLWFRDASPWKVLEEILLPKYIDELTSGQKTQIRIWCSAVSTGQEAYSTAMCIDNYLKKNNLLNVKLSDFDFFATDISTRVLDIAKTGRYDSISIQRGLSDYYRIKYFVNDEAAWDLDPKIRDAVKFVPFNLQNNYHDLGKFDIIFCRYVLIYFAQEFKKEIISKMHDSLNDDGVIFTGNDSLYEYLEDNFITKHYNNFTYYIKKQFGK